MNNLWPPSASFLNSTYVRFLSRLIARITRLAPPPQGGHRIPAARYIATAGGGAVRLRPLAGDDRAALRTFFAALSESSRQWRFLARRPALTEAELSWLLTLRTGRHWSWVAETVGPGRRLLGVAQGYRDKPEGTEAEIAVAVLDDVQGRGLGRALLAVIAAEARAVGLRGLYGYTLADNTRMLHYGQRRGARAIPATDGIVELRFDPARLAAELPPAASGRAAVGTTRQIPTEFPGDLPLPGVY